MLGLSKLLTVAATKILPRSFWGTKRDIAFKMHHDLSSINSLEDQKFLVDTAIERSDGHVTQVLQDIIDFNGLNNKGLLIDHILSQTTNRDVAINNILLPYYAENKNHEEFLKSFDGADLRAINQEIKNFLVEYCIQIDAIDQAKSLVAAGAIISSETLQSLLKDNLPLLKELLTSGVTVINRDSDFISKLIVTLLSKDEIDLTKTICASFVNKAKIVPPLANLLLDAIEKRNYDFVKKVREVVREDIFIDAINYQYWLCDNNTGLHIMLNRSNIEAAIDFLNYGANPNIGNKYKIYPIHLATKSQIIYQGDKGLDVLLLILKKGADPTVKNADGKSAQDYCSQDDSSYNDISRYITKLLQIFTPTDGFPSLLLLAKKAVIKHYGMDLLDPLLNQEGSYDADIILNLLADLGRKEAISILERPFEEENFIESKVEEIMMIGNTNET